MHVTATCVLFNTIIRLSTFTLVIPTLLSQTHPTVYRNFYNVYSGKYGRGWGGRKIQLQYVCIALPNIFIYIFKMSKKYQTKLAVTYLFKKSCAN